MELGFGGWHEEDFGTYSRGVRGLEVARFFVSFHVELSIQAGEADVLFGAVLVVEDMPVQGSGLNSLVGIMDLLDEVPVRSECSIWVAVGIFRLIVRARVVRP
jgi:hypothetical protein